MAKPKLKIPFSDPDLQDRARRQIIARQIKVRSACECLDCGRRWIAIHQLAWPTLECSCGSSNTVRGDHPDEPTVFPMS